MTRKILVSVTALSLSAFALLAQAGCASPCPAHNGTIDGYCDGTVAMNCRLTCGDCSDSWQKVACPGTCSVTATQPADGTIPFSEPMQAKPNAWAVCVP